MSGPAQEPLSVDDFQDRGDLAGGVAAFPEMKGFSTSNLKYMRSFAEMCPSLQIGQQPAAPLPWFHKDEQPPK
jgi:hypothetical protein